VQVRLRLLRAEGRGHDGAGAVEDAVGREQGGVAVEADGPHGPTPRRRSRQRRRHGRQVDHEGDRQRDPGLIIIFFLIDTHAFCENKMVLLFAAQDYPRLKGDTCK